MFTDEFKLIDGKLPLQIVRRCLSDDMILIKSYDYLGKQRVEIGITDFSKMGQAVEMQIYLGGFRFDRISTGIIPNEYAGDICTCQVYELNNT
jgi:hypothetical protein